MGPYPTLPGNPRRYIEGELPRLWRGHTVCKAADGPASHIWGSSELLQTLIVGDLVDEYRIWVFPLVLGEGKRLFENCVPPRGLTLVETRSTPAGVHINTYLPADPSLRVGSLSMFVGSRRQS
jgi:dihydrofolate reductase